MSALHGGLAASGVGALGPDDAGADDPDDLSVLDAPARVAVLGMGVTGWAVADALMSRGHQVMCLDDRPDMSDAARPAASSAALSASSLPVSDAVLFADAAALGAEVDVLVPSPGVPPWHPVCRAAMQAGVTTMGEFDLARRWDARPVCAVTGTNGKTTVTTLVTSILNRSGIAAAGVGNTDTPWVAALDADARTQRAQQRAHRTRPDAAAAPCRTDLAQDRGDRCSEAQVFVVEASSFRLHRVRRLAPQVALWLNVAPDHLDWHRSYEQYAAAKARIFRGQGPDDVAIVPFGDEQIARFLPAGRAKLPRTVTFAAGDGRLGRAGGCDAGVSGGRLRVFGETVARVDDLRRRLPHDVSNAAAVAAAALALGASVQAVGDVLTAFDGLPHRLAAAGRVGDVSFFDDSKSTAPHATAAALRALPNAVLIAGGQNKALDLSEMCRPDALPRAVVAIGQAASEVEAAFRGVVGVHRASDMDEAVATAFELADRSGTVLLSPGCASFDAYRSYRQRGEAFAAAVERLAAARRSPSAVLRAGADRPAHSSPADSGPARGATYA